jgi:hypothetical protein
MEKHKHAVETANALFNDPQYAQIRDGHNYDASQYRRDLAVIYTGTLVRLAKMYGPAVVLGLASVAALTGSHVVLTRRYAGATAAYAAVHKSFLEYRKRVVEQYGDEADRTLRYDLIDKTVVEETDTGPVTTTMKVLRNGEPSMYARLFDKSTSTSWSKDPGYNRQFISSVQNYANDKLKAQGHLTLNEVYEMLGMEKTKEGLLVGWVLGDCGDGYVDFGVFSGDRIMGMEFVTGNELSVWLDFNVTGIIYDLI